MTTVLNGYKAFYKNKTMEVYAETSLQAQTIAAKEFKARKQYDVTVVLCERADSTTVIHHAVN
jgi:hypothetical protein